MMASSAPKKKSVRYVTIKILQQGGMAQVFLARRDPPNDHGELFVLKTLLPQLADDQTFRTMFLDEIRLCRRLDHPNLVRTFGIGRSAKRPYLVMEYLDGLSLKEICHAIDEAQKPLPCQLMAHIAAQVCDGLEYAHTLTNERGEPLEIIHRDVSPENIIVLYSGGVKLVDFGISKAIDRLSRTVAGTIKGKFAYMTPEQVLNNPVDARSDIFSLGVVCWELLANRRLFKCDLDIDTMRAVAFSKVPELSLWRPDVPFELESIIQKALQKEPAQRFQSAREMGTALRDFLKLHHPSVNDRTVALFIEDLESESQPTLRTGTQKARTSVPTCEETVQSSFVPGLMLRTKPQRDNASQPPSIRNESEWLSGVFADDSQNRRLVPPPIPVAAIRTDPPTAVGYRLSSSGSVQVDASVLDGIPGSRPPEVPGEVDPEAEKVTEPPPAVRPPPGLWTRLRGYFRFKTPSGG